MNLQPIAPPLREGQRVLCAQCGSFSAADMVADLDAPSGTFYHRNHVCRNIGRARINADGTENWCNRNGLDRCGICNLNPNID